VFSKYQKKAEAIFEEPVIKARGESYQSEGSHHKNYSKGMDIREWDIAPPPEYFEELARVSKNQIIWGGNYFDLPPTRCFLIWEKLTISENFTMAMCEYAWTSFNENAKIFKYQPQDKARFHPTQKPVALYEWILSRYAKPGDKILDTHAGSASSLVACHNMGYDFLGCEIDAGYYQLANERLKAAQAQLTLF
jgi:site-specific DNA-methyltransferase (adenine-specific)